MESDIIPSESIQEGYRRFNSLSLMIVSFKGLKEGLMALSDTDNSSSDR